MEANAIRRFQRMQSNFSDLYKTYAGFCKLKELAKRKKLAKSSICGESYVIITRKCRIFGTVNLDHSDSPT